jgi:hypothetical protein
VLDAQRLGMLSYETDGRVLTLRVKGDTTIDERAVTFTAIRGDARVPVGVLLMLDQRRGWMISSSPSLIAGRLRLLLTELGGKLGSVWALICETDAQKVEARVAQTIARDMNIQIGIFDDEASARVWLKTFSDKPASQLSPLCHPFSIATPSPDSSPFMSLSAWNRDTSRVSMSSAA